MSNKISIGIIGCGGITSEVHLPLLMNVEDVKVTYLADLFAPEKLAKAYNCQAIKISEDISTLPQSDIVFLGTPLGVREKYIQEFAKREALIATEKPFAANTNQHLSFLNLSKKISCNYLTVFYSPIQQMREIVFSNLFGELKRVILTEGGIVRATGREKNHYQTNISLSGGGILMEKGCHSLSQLTFILQDYQFKVINANIQWHHQLDIDVDAHIQASHDNNVELEYRLSMIKPLKNMIKFVFDTAEVTLDHTDPSRPLHISAAKNYSLDFAVELNRSWALSPIQAFYLKWMHIVNLLKSAAEIDTASETSLTTTVLINDIYEAAGA